MFIRLGFVILFLSVTSANSVSASCAPKCITYILPRWYNYVNFIPFSLINGGRPVGYRIEFNFYVMGTEDLHVALTRGQNLERYYEIVYGASSNTQVEFRDRAGEFGGFTVLSVADTPGILNSTNWVLLSLKLLTVTTGGANLEFYRDGSSVPFLVVFLPDADELNNFSFTSHNNNAAQMMYNCPPPHCMGF